jgi:hypothetical protein
MSDQPEVVSVPEPSAEVPEPTLAQGEAEPAGVGGFLVLVAIGVFLAPVINALVVLVTYPPLFTGPAWAIVTTPGSAAYHALWAPLIIGEISMNVAFIAVGVWLIVLFLRRARRFPPVYMGYMITSALFLFIHSQLLAVVLKGQPALAGDNSSLGRAVISAAIWVPYMLSSRRVKNTFVN